MPTALDLIESAALKLGAKATGESLTADEANDSLSILNSFLDSMRIDEMMVYQIAQNTYSWTGGQVSRTIGPAGNFNGSRPIKIISAFFRDGQFDYPAMVIENRDAYDRISFKSNETNYPNVIYYDPGFPLGTIYAHPVPSSTIPIYINHWQTLQEFATLTTAFALPPGYQWMIENNLAIALEPVFSVPASQSVYKAASESMSAIKRVNHRPINSMNDIYLHGRRSDIYSDQ